MSEKKELTEDSKEKKIEELTDHYYKQVLWKIATDPQCTLTVLLAWYQPESPLSAPHFFEDIRSIIKDALTLLFELKEREGKRDEQG